MLIIFFIRAVRMGDMDRINSSVSGMIMSGSNPGVAENTRWFRVN